MYLINEAQKSLWKFPAALGCKIILKSKYRILHVYMCEKENMFIYICMFGSCSCSKLSSWAEEAVPTTVFNGIRVQISKLPFGVRAIRHRREGDGKKRDFKIFSFECLISLMIIVYRNLGPCRA